MSVAPAWAPPVAKPPHAGPDEPEPEPDRDDGTTPAAGPARLLPGRRMPAALAAAVAPALLAAFHPGLLWLWLCAVFAIVALAATDVGRLLAPGALRARRLVPPRLDLGVPTTVRVELSRAPGPGGEVTVDIRDDPPDALLPGATADGRCRLPAGGAAYLDYTVRATERGLYRFGDVWLRWEGPLGLVASMARIPSGGDVKVYPDLRALRTADALRLPLLLREMGLKELRKRGGSTEFDSLREHGPDDGLQAIDWKATARRQKPIVRTFREEQNHDVVLALDCGRLMGTRPDGVSKLDHALNGALLLARTSLLKGDRPGLIAFHQRVLAFVRPDGAPSQLSRLVEASYALRTDYSETSFRRALLHLEARHRKRSFVVFLTDFVHGQADEEMIEAVGRAAKRHLALFVAVRDPHLRRIAFARPQDGADPFRQAVALELLEDRRRVLGLMARRGIHTLDVDPGAIAAPVLNAYLSLRGMV
ncbi:DUF58 domain-containing protein [Myxococcota bacterium]|nr:DUF58 domain-containing protein [Myxococcota bacterium]